MIEEWRQYCTNYWVSNLGRAKGPRGILKPYPNTSGYLQIRIYYPDGRCRKEFLSMIVAMCWLQNPNGYKFIHHKDENPANNRPDNLEWVATKNHSDKRSLERKSLNRFRLKKDIAQIDADNGDIIKIWCRKKLKQDPSFHFPYILRCCNSGCKHRGYKWKYITSHQQKTIF